MTKYHKLHSVLLRSSLNRSQVFPAAFPSLTTGGLNYNKISGPPRTQDLFLATTKRSVVIHNHQWRSFSSDQQKQQSTTKSSTRMGDKQGVTPAALEVDPHDTLFAKMIRGEIKPNIVHENEHALVFTDVNPNAPTHLLIIPKKLALGQIHNAKESDANELGQLLLTAGEVAKKLDLLDGYRLVINQGLDAQQSVNYLHIHLLSGRKFSWPPG